MTPGKGIFSRTPPFSSLACPNGYFRTSPPKLFCHSVCHSAVSVRAHDFQSDVPRATRVARLAAIRQHVAPRRLPSLPSDVCSPRHSRIRPARRVPRALWPSFFSREVKGENLSKRKLGKGNLAKIGRVAVCECAEMAGNADFVKLAGHVLTSVLTSRRNRRKPLIISGADGGGFEPPLPFGKHAFQACAIDRSATHPDASCPASAGAQYNGNSAAAQARCRLSSGGTRAEFCGRSDKRRKFLKSRSSSTLHRRVRRRSCGSTHTLRFPAIRFPILEPGTYRA